MIYQSTKALSVYSVLSLTGRNLTRAEIASGLRSFFDRNLSDEYVPEGAQYLLDKGFVHEEGELLCIANRDPNTGRGPELIRSGDDRDLLRASHSGRHAGISTFSVAR